MTCKRPRIGRKDLRGGNLLLFPKPSFFLSKTNARKKRGKKRVLESVYEGPKRTPRALIPKERGKPVSFLAGIKRGKWGSLQRGEKGVEPSSDSYPDRKNISLKKEGGKKRRYIIVCGGGVRIRGREDKVSSSLRCKKKKVLQAFPLQKGEKKKTS